MDMDSYESDVNLDDSADIFANSSAETVEEVNVANLSVEEVMGLDRLAAELAHTSSSNIYAVPEQSLNTSLSKNDVPLSDTSLDPANLTLHSTDTSFVLSQIIREACSPPQRIYCPFCVSDFGFEFLLKAHIKESHLSILHRLLRNQASDMEYHPCPFCPAKFYMKKLLPRHMLNKHDLCTLDTFPSTDSSHITCHFCHYKVLRRHFRLLSVHIERKHIPEFEAYIYRRYSKTMQSCDDLRFLNSEFQVTDQIVSPGLSDGMAALRTHDDKVIYERRPLVIKPILKGCMDPDPTESLALLDSPNMEDRASAMTLGRTACRRLRFDLPDSPLEDKPRIEPRMKQVFAKSSKRFKWKFSLRRKKKKENMNRMDSVSLLSSPLKVTPVKSSFPDIPSESSCDSEVFRYKCGICCERFSANGGLVEHVRRRHKGIKLRSMYHCGECSAKFFRNSFLVQHCTLQHSPLCLNARSRRSIAY